MGNTSKVAPRISGPGSMKLKEAGRNTDQGRRSIEKRLFTSGVTKVGTSKSGSFNPVRNKLMVDTESTRKDWDNFQPSKSRKPRQVAPAFYGEYE